ncbi:hypothetical protein KKF55_06650, partial [Patescibacteria group bacterium]|nr:hypothetical protein [Patescibacteria group bacterium]
MVVIPVEKINIITTLDRRETILKYLHNSEIMEIHEICPPCETPIREDEIQTELCMAEIKNALQFLESVIKRPKGFIESFLEAKEEVDEKTYQETFKDFDHQASLKEIKDLETHLSNLNNLESRLHEDIKELGAWKGVDIKLNELKRPFFCLALASIHPKKYEKLSQELKQQPLIHLETISK